MKVKILRRKHLGGGKIAYPGQTLTMVKEKAEALITAGYAEEVGGKKEAAEEATEGEEEPGWRRKEPCEGCPE